MLIVDMQMPKNCWLCNLAYFSDDYNDERGAYMIAICKADKQERTVGENETERPSWCPIKGELPDEHGDLIDRDVSIQTFKCIEEAPYSAFDGQEAFYAPEDVVNTLLCQDVVIAAERKDDEQIH